MAKSKIVAMLDCETLSLARNAAVIDIGLVVMHPGGINSSYRWLIDPESYQGNNKFHVDQETVNFHNRQNTGLIETATMRGKSWEVAAEDLFGTLTPLVYYHELHVWAKGKDFDGPVIEHFLKRAGYPVPWRHTNLHCLRDLAQLFPEVRARQLGDHTALKDAEAQACHLMDIAAYSERASNYIFGKN